MPDSSPDPVIAAVVSCPFCETALEVSRGTARGADVICPQCGRDLDTPLAIVAQLQRLGREMAARAGRRW